MIVKLDYYIWIFSAISLFILYITSHSGYNDTNMDVLVANKQIKYIQAINMNDLRRSTALFVHSCITNIVSV